MTGRAGVTASDHCSLCQAGSYGTGSGEGLRLLSMRSGFGCDLLVVLTLVSPNLSFFAPDLWLVELGRYSEYNPLPCETSYVRDGACRRDGKRELQPVPGGELWDWVR